MGIRVVDKNAYHIGTQLAFSPVPFYALIVAALITADTDNAALLANAFPDVVHDIQEHDAALARSLSQNHGTVCGRCFQSTCQCSNQ